RAERAGDFNRAAEIRHGELPTLERELAERDGAHPENAMVKEEVDEDDVAVVIARWTGIPVDRLLEGETEKLIHMEEGLHQRLVGAPPGYVGYEEGGQLTEAVRRRPYSVILLDEIEKAHHEVFDVLLQILDDGRLTDGQGRTVDFRNTVLIMTSNLRSPDQLH